jgi:hypothetical protein
MRISHSHLWPLAIHVPLNIAGLIPTTVICEKFLIVCNNHDASMTLEQVIEISSLCLVC